MTFHITITGAGAADDDVRAAFESAVRELRAVGDAAALEAELVTGGATYTEADVSDEAADTDEGED